MLRRFLRALARRWVYAIDLLKFFYIQRFKGFEAPISPCLDDETAAWLQEQLQETRLFLEFGCGGSTVLADRLAVPTISVESDPYYATAVRGALSDSTATVIVTPPMGITRQWGMPMFFKKWKGRRYVTAPFRRLDGHFPDLIFIDGRYRVACALESAARAALAGASPNLLIDDYGSRPQYHVLEQYLGPPRRIGRSAMFAAGKADIPEKAILSHAMDAR